jgi:hypothetical protein
MFGTMVEVVVISSCGILMSCGSVVGLVSHGRTCSPGISKIMSLLLYMKQS